MRSWTSWRPRCWAFVGAVAIWEGNARADDAVVGQFEDLTRQNEVLEQENELLTSYLQRNAPGWTGSDDEDKKDERDKKAARQRRPKVQVTLSVEQKNDICSAELEEAQKALEETKRTSERLIDTLRAVLEETDIRIAELKKDAYEFKRDIVVGAENFRTGKTIAEKMIRYMEEKLRQKDAVVEKLRLKNATLKSQAQKIDAQLRHKEEMGDALHYIDFHQLQIENKQYVAKIEERNEELLKLKQTTGSTVQVLNNLKKKLHELTEESAWLQSEIKSRTELNEKILEEIASVEAKNQKDDKKLQSLQVQQLAEPSKDPPQARTSFSVLLASKAYIRSFDIRSWTTWLRKPKCTSCSRKSRTTSARSRLQSVLRKQPADGTQVELREASWKCMNSS